MLGIILWLQLVSILQHCFMSLQSHSDCQRTDIDPHIQLLAVHASIPAGRIILFYRVHGLRHHIQEKSVLRVVIPAIHDQTCSPLKYSANHMEPTTHWEVHNKPPTQREYCPSCDDTGGIRNLASSPSSQFTLFYCNHRSHHSCTILQPFRVFAFQPKLSQMLSEADCGHDILIDIDVNYVGGCRYCSSMCGAPAHTPPGSPPLPETDTQLSSPLGV